jgi:hypothetical protein
MQTREPNRRADVGGQLVPDWLETVSVTTLIKLFAIVWGPIVAGLFIAALAQ